MGREMIRNPLSLIRRALAAFRPPLRRQIAALCWRRDKSGEVEFLLVTTRRTSRWTPPRGWPMEGRTMAEAAAVEAWEEAGARGVVADMPAGAYRYDKLKSVGGLGSPVEVTVFPMEIESLEVVYPEASQRKRRWMPRDAAADAVREPSLKRVILGFTP